MRRIEAEEKLSVTVEVVTHSLFEYCAELHNLCVVCVSPRFSVCVNVCVCVSPRHFHFTNLPVQTVSSLRRRLSSLWFMSLIKPVCVCMCVCSLGPYCPLQSLHELSFHSLSLPPWLTIAVNVAVNVLEVPLSDWCPWARAWLLLPVC